MQPRRQASTEEVAATETAAKTSQSLSTDKQLGDLSEGTDELHTKAKRLQDETIPMKKRSENLKHENEATKIENGKLDATTCVLANLQKDLERLKTDYDTLRKNIEEKTAEDNTENQISARKWNL